MRASRTTPVEVCNRIFRVWKGLEEHYGRPQLRPNRDPVGELVQTILSQHTTDASSGKAYQQLKERYPTWQAVEEAPVDELAQTIRFAGLPSQKASTIKRALRDMDSESLARLATLPVAEARKQLTAIRGVGDKTASCVLLFALGMPAQPVDTHIERVSKRLGITNAASTATGIQNVFEHCLPANGEMMYAFHVDMVRHGREICQARVPRCEICFLSRNCDYYSHHVGVC